MKIKIDKEKLIKLLLVSFIYGLLNMLIVQPMILKVIIHIFGLIAYIWACGAFKVNKDN